MTARDDRQGRDSGMASSGDDQSALDEALQHNHSGNAGDIDSNRNLSGSMTYETLREQGDLDVEQVTPPDDPNESSRSPGSGRPPGGGSGGMQ